MLKTFKNTIKGDFFGAIIASIIAFPQALAFGVASNLGAISGLWGAIILSLFAGLIGCNIPLVSGPTGPSAIIIATLSSIMLPDKEGVFLVLMLASILQILICFTSIPRLFKYIPYPVISGFLTGIGLIIIILQIPPLLGGQIYSSTFEAFRAISQIFSNIDYLSASIGLFTLLILFFTPKFITKYVPSGLLALVLATGVTILFNLDVEKISAISFAFPSFKIPSFSFEIISTYFPLALAFAFVATSESLLSGVVIDSLTKVKHNSKRLTLAQGVGNLMCALFGSMSGSGATMRSVAAIKAGATTRFCAILSALILLLSLYKFTFFISQIPLCVLSAILIKIGYDILDLKVIKVLKLAPVDDLLVLIIVLFLTVFYNLITALGVGIVLASILFAKRIADNTNIKYKESEYSKQEAEIELNSHHKIRILHLDGQFFFGSISQIVSHFDELLETKCVILTYNSNLAFDMSSIFALEDILVRLKAQKIKLFLVLENENVYNQICSMDEKIYGIDKNSIFNDEFEAIKVAKQNLLPQV